VLKKLYPRRGAGRSVETASGVFNTTPHIVTLLLGITTAMEEKNSQQKNMDATAIDNVKASLMGPLAGLGDSFSGGRCA
jgi:fructoselysine and glucoselysine-specific PTS system IID component